ncbi:MAG: amino acid ABC transporter permease [Bauldia sp.]|nr:amino acid ABC transporter permease [Bauldia sp.]
MAVSEHVDHVGRRPARASMLYDPRVRGIVVQVVLAIAVVVFFVWIANNTYENLRRANIASGFGFVWQRSGFDISQTLIPYSIESTYGRAFLVGLLNTLLVAVVGIVLASIIGFLLGVARLSRNWLISRIATVYVETLRNIPVLLQLLFWYKAVLSVLPGPQQGFPLPFGSNLSNRGLILPNPIPQPGFVATPIAIFVAVVAVALLARWSRTRQMATGKRFPMIWAAIPILVGLPLLVFLAAGAPLAIEYPELRGFNFVGGLHISPEFTALTLGLVLYTSTYIGEIVRAGILAVSHGQTEAAYAVGLRPRQTLRLIIVPQALRVIIPPLTSQYLNLIKNSSLAIAVGYPDLVGVFARTVLNQTGQAVEVILITMLVYLAISLATSLFMNWFNARVALVER